MVGRSLSQSVGACACVREHKIDPTHTSTHPEPQALMHAPASEKYLSAFCRFFFTPVPALSPPSVSLPLPPPTLAAAMNFCWY